MICAWDCLYDLIPADLRQKVRSKGTEALQELRLRMGRPVELKENKGSVFLDSVVSKQDLSYILNAASRYSPWSADTIKDGYVTAPGGHPIGLCGEAVIQNGQMQGIRVLSSMCIRVAKDYPGIGEDDRFLSGSILIIGSPGSGKTTLLRDVIRCRSNKNHQAICVVDERGELFPSVNGQSIFPPGARTDVMTLCSKPYGVLTALKTMGPGCIAVDEITSPEDLRALVQAAWCGVDVLATLHAGSMRDMTRKELYRSVLNSSIFSLILVMKPDKSWTMERMEL